MKREDIFYLGWIMLLVLCVASFVRAVDTPPAAQEVPDPYARRILKDQRDEANLQSQMLQLQQQFNQAQQLYQKDETDIADAKSAALKAAGKDETWDVDLNALTFVEKPKPAPAPAAK